MVQRPLECMCHRLDGAGHPRSLFCDPSVGLRLCAQFLDRVASATPGPRVSRGPARARMHRVGPGRLHACKEALRTDENSDGVVRQYGALEFFGERRLLVGAGLPRR